MKSRVGKKFECAASLASRLETKIIQYILYIHKTVVTWTEIKDVRKLDEHRGRAEITLYNGGAQ